jgi:predicted nuclease of restriction endonuclease-like (RecB) superfamily
MGHLISSKLKSAAWGEGVVDQLASYIQEHAPELKGFTRRSLYRMRQFYEAYEGNEKVSTLLTQLPWSAHLHILAKTSTTEEKQFYLLLAIREKYSVRELERQIDSGYYERYSLAQGRQEKFVSTAMERIHPGGSSSFLDTYVLDFLNLPQGHNEGDFQQSIVSNLKHFILETGRDFSFMGQNYRIQVGDKDFYIDLLFYHRALQSLVAFELKITEFKPEYMGQLDFYLEALDREVKKEHEKPSIGILLCKSKNDEIVTFSLNRSLSPTLIAQYETALIDKNLLKQKLHEFYELENQREKSDKK